jgi:hypothetical protein
MSRDDVMMRLQAVEPMPRGERLARMIEDPPKNGDGHTDRMLYPLWDRMIDRGRILLPLDDVFALETAAQAAALWRSYAAPLRRCREERKRLRQKLVECMNGTTPVVESDVVLGLRKENERLRVIFEFFEEKSSSRGEEINRLNVENARLRAALEEANRTR